MADYPLSSSAGRSANMRANRRRDTKPELELRRALHSRGYRYRKDFRLDLTGGARVRPDIAFTARKVAVFVDGCFWHGCPQHGSKPAVNVWYWEPKLRRNAERDRAADTALAAAGWAVVRVWEHEPLDAAVATVVAALSQAAGGPLSEKLRVQEAPMGLPPDGLATEGLAADEGLATEGLATEDALPGGVLVSDGLPPAAEVLPESGALPERQPS